MATIHEPKCFPYGVIATLIIAGTVIYMEMLPYPVDVIRKEYKNRILNLLLYYLDSLVEIIRCTYVEIGLVLWRQIVAPSDGNAYTVLTRYDLI